MEADLLRFLQLPQPAHPADEECPPAEENLRYLRDECRVLIVGAGALGCEVIYGLAKTGFRHIEIIDMDTIEVSNLNRQFLFKTSDVGRSKAEVAAAAIQRLFPDLQVAPHVGRLQDKPPPFFASFNMVVGGLDNVEARRWLNSVLHSLLVRDAQGNIDPSSVIPWFDGGSEGFGGQVKTIIPGYTACFECTLWSLPAKKTYPLCTIADHPRTPEHCIEFALVIAYPQQHRGEAPDLDDAGTLSWLLECAQSRAAKFGIAGVTQSLLLGVAKAIVPAVGATNAVVGGALTLEAFKLATAAGPQLNSYLMLMGGDGFNWSVLPVQPLEDCLVCRCGVAYVKVDVQKTTLKQFIDLLCADSTTEGGGRASSTTTTTSSSSLMLSAPSLSQNGKIIFIQAPASLRAAHEHKLSLTLSQLAAAQLLDIQAPLDVTDAALCVPIKLRLAA